MIKKKDQPRDAVEVMDDLTNHLCAATGVVHACSIAALIPIRLITAASTTPLRRRSSACRAPRP